MSLEELIRETVRDAVRAELAPLLARLNGRKKPEWINITEFCKRTGRDPKTGRGSVLKMCQENEGTSLARQRNGAQSSWEINWTKYNES